MPAFAILLLGPALDAGAVEPARWSSLLADVGIAVVGTLVGALAIQTRARDLIVPLIALPLLVPGGHRRGAGLRARCSRRAAQGRSPGAGWRSSASMIWSSGCWPTRSSTSCSRTDAGDPPMYGTRLRLLSLATVVTLDRGLRAGRVRRADGRRPGLHRRRSSTCTCRWRSSRSAASSSAGSCAIQHLRTRRPRATTCAPTSRSTSSLVLGVGVLLTGAIWARASWGVWWVWDEPTLVIFLIVFLLYCTYQPLRFSIEDREKQARYASVFAITAGAFVPLNFLAVRLAELAASTRARCDSAGDLPGRDAHRVPGLPRSGWRCSS